MERPKTPFSALALAALLCLPAGAGQSGPGPDYIVFIADSHGVLDFGQGIETWLQGRANTKYDFFASGASGPREWTRTRFQTPCGYHHGGSASASARGCYQLATPHLTELWDTQTAIPADARRISIIALGTNYAMAGRADEVTDSKSLIRDAFSRSGVCIWIGPPNMTRTPGYDKAAVEYKYGIIREAINAVAGDIGKRCVLIDSRPISTYPREGGDGVHYQWLKTQDPISLAEGARWAARAAQRVEDSLP